MLEESAALSHPYLLRRSPTMPVSGASAALKRRPSFVPTIALVRSLWLAGTLLVVAPVAPAQSVMAQAAPPAPVRVSSPDGWVGTWRGALTAYGAVDSVKITVPVTLTITPLAEAGAFRWRHVYANDSTRNVKDYVLRTLDAAAGRYATDENNGIVLDEQFIGGMLVSVFQVGEQVIENRTEVRGDTLTQDLIAWRRAPVRETRSAVPNGEQGAPVTSFRVTSRQRSVLVRAGR